MPVLPDLRQERDWDCGRAVFLAFCELYGVKPRGMAKLANEVQGLSPDSLEAAFRAVGFSVFSGSLTVPLLRVLTREGFAVAALVQHEGSGHWIAVEGFQGNRFHLHCPDRGKVKEVVSQWEPKWWDSHFSGGSYSNWGIVPYL